MNILDDYSFEVQIKAIDGYARPKMGLFRVKHSKSGDETFFSLIYGVANNCQRCCIGRFDSIYSFVKRTLGENEEDIKTVLLNIFYRAVKSLKGSYERFDIVELDVRFNYEDIVDSMFKNNIMHKIPYTSTNGSVMIVYFLSFKEYNNIYSHLKPF